MTIRNVQSLTFASGKAIADTVVESSRIILLGSGQIDYTVEDVSHRIESPALLFVPAWVRRSWKSVRRGSIHISWCEFCADVFEPGFRELVSSRSAEWLVETASFHRMHQCWEGDPYASQKPDIALKLEGETKAVLARLLSSAELQSAPQKANGSLRPEVVKALAWLEKNFTQEDAVTLLKKQTSRGEAGFRRMFKQQTKFTPTAYLLALRMRYARFLLHAGELSVKEVAAAVGFHDPFWFSRQYHAYWGHPPKQARARVV